jgi:hypothetical protein
MATIKDLLAQVTFDEVWTELAAANGDIETYRDSFAKMFEDLCAAEPAPNTQQMTVWLKMAEDPFAGFFEDDEEDGEDDSEDEEYLQVFAYVPGDEDSYAIGVKPADQIVGLDVADETVQNYSPALIIAYCMMEITYSSSMANSTYGTQLDRAGGGIYAAQSCVEGGLHGLSLDHLREEMGLGEKKEDLKEKYGFLF